MITVYKLVPVCGMYARGDEVETYDDVKSWFGALAFEHANFMPETYSVHFVDRDIAAKCLTDIPAETARVDGPDGSIYYGAFLA